MANRRRILAFIFVVCKIAFVYSCKEESIRFLSNLDIRGPDTVSDYWTDGQGIIVTDHELQTAWYRTVYNGWQYTMSDKDNMPDYTTCSTYWPIYLKDSHPPTDKLGEDPVDVIACIRDDLSPCSTLYNIQIRKCDEEIQYHLTHTAWYSAYCFKQSVQLKEEIAPAPQNVNFGNVVVLPELKFSSEPINTMIWYVPYIAFRCNFTEQKELYYSVDWYIDKTPFKETLGPTKNLDELTLPETNIISKNLKLPFQLRCGVSASSDYDGLKTPETFSPLFYAGMKILNSTLLLDKESAATVKMVSTIPIGCKYFKRPDGRIPKNVCKVEMKLFVENENQFSCTKQRGTIMNKVEQNEESGNQMCAKYINTLNEEDKWQPDTQHNFTVVTSDHTYEDDSEFILKLQMGDNGHPLWNNYLFPDIQIFIQNMEMYQKKICKARNDPHMSTFDGYLYEQQDEGTFILYINKKYGIEVQHTVKQCNQFATCTCGVAVSAGQDIFEINRCGEPKFLGFTQCGDGGILDVVRVHDYLYRV